MLSLSVPVRMSALFLCVVALLGLAACAPATKQAVEVFPHTHVKQLMRYNYLAVDTMIERAGRRVTPASPLVVGTVVDVSQVERSSPLGRMIAEQLGARLSQKGFRVAETKLRQGISIQDGSAHPSAAGEFIYSRDADAVSQEQRAVAALSGTYAVANDHVLVNLRLVDIRSGQLVTAYDYVLPKTPDVEALLVSGDRLRQDSFFSKGWAY